MEPKWLSNAPEAGKPDTYLPMMQNILENQIQEYGFSGRTVHVDMRKSDIHGTVFSGLADPGTGRKLSGREPSRMASMTKTYTAAAILRLMEQGKLALDSSIGDYLTEESQRILRSADYDISAITVRQLLVHTSGLLDFVDQPFKDRIFNDPQHRWTRREQLEWAANRTDQPHGVPGVKFVYTDTEYILLGEMIEQLSGLPQPEAYRTLLRFDALGLRHTWFETLEPAPTDLPERAHQFYGTLDVTGFDPSFDLYGGGGLVSTVQDEAAFLRALMTGGVFDSPDTLAQMLHVPPVNEDADGNGAGAGMGIFRYPAEEGTAVCYGHGGAWGTWFLHCPEFDVTIAADRYQAIVPKEFNPDRANVVALRMNRLALHPAHVPGQEET